ncbi:MAG: hypothetical protein ACRD1K_14325 [Acidimicrobiales bacterium]
MASVRLAAARWLRRPLLAAAVLLALYGALSFVNDPAGQLGSDSGSKAATLRVMAESGRLDPDLGYWAERWDPAGRVHPFVYTKRIDDRWVNVTTLPMLYAAYPLYRLGGYRLALLLPMLGAVLSALAARALARRISAGDGWPAFWLVGLASPLAVYAIDFWEHSLGLAAMAWATVFLHDAVEHRRGWPVAAAAGGLFGVAATLRTEAFVYGAVATALACLVVLVVLVGRRRPYQALGIGLATSAGLAAALAANFLLEVATVGGSIRGARITGIASGAVADAGDTFGLRVQEAAVSATGLFPSLEAAVLAFGFILAALLAYATFRLSRPGDAGPAVIAVVGIVALYAIRFAVGGEVLPSLVAMTPLAVVGAVLGWSHRPARYFLGVAVLALPLVWATEYVGGATNAVGARYILMTGLILGTVGVVALPRLRRWARHGVVALAVVVTAYGLAGMSNLTHGWARVAAELAARPEPVLVSRFSQLARVTGGTYGKHRWLSVIDDADQAFAVGVLEQAGVTRFGLILAPDDEPEPVAGWSEVGRDEVVLPRYGATTIVTYDIGSAEPRH